MLGLFFSLLVVAIFTLGTSEVAYAQQATGRIIGNVTDSSASPIAGAKITVRNLATQTSQATKTDKEGFDEVLSLRIGTYDVTIEVTGFRKEVFEHQALQINQSLRLDATLAVGSLTDTVEVSRIIQLALRLSL